MRFTFFSSENDRRSGHETQFSVCRSCFFALPVVSNWVQASRTRLDINFNVTRTIYCCQPLQARFPAVVAGAKSSGALPPMNSQAPPFEHPFKIRLERGTVLPLVWLALGSAALAEIAARSVPAAIVLDLQHGLWERGSLEAAAGIAGVCTSVIARTADFSAPAVGAALDAGVAAVMAPLVESADDARVLAGPSRYPPQGRRSGGGVRP